MEYIIILGLVGFAIYWFFFRKEGGTSVQHINQQEVSKFTAEFVSIGEEYSKSGVPVIESDIKLKKNENLHVKLRDVRWMEHRKVSTGRGSYNGLSGRIKLAKGLSYRYGTGEFSRETMNQLTELDSGDLYVTNKGFFFRGKIGNKNIDHDNVVMLRPSTIGFVIERQTGKAVYIPFPFAQYPQYMSAIVIAWNSVSGSKNV